jgi:ABC-type glutathione transport system ATPase component
VLVSDDAEDESAPAVDYVHEAAPAGLPAGAYHSHTVIESPCLGKCMHGDSITHIQARRCAGVVLRGLRKVYEGASWLPCGSGSEAVIAVDSLDLTMYRGQLFCLLGQNGAGKSSVIGMLTGLFPMTVSGPNGPPRSTQLAQLNSLNSTDSTQLTQLN